MAHLLTRDDKHPDLSCNEDSRWFLITRRETPSAYRFGRTQAKPGGARAALGRVNGYLKNMIEAIANAKLRRMERELELRGIRHDRANDSWVTRKSQPMEPSR
jgi:hypothetical protein